MVLVSTRSRGLAGAACAVLLVSGLTARVGPFARLTGARLDALGGAVSYCYQSPSQADWLTRSQVGTVLGLESVQLSPGAGGVTVTRVELQNATGGLAVTRAAFVPAGAIASGFTGDHAFTNTLNQTPRQLPAALTYLSASRLPVNAPHDPGVWEPGIVVTMPASVDEASASGVTLTYRSGWRTHTVTLHGGIDLRRTPCS